MKKKTRIATGSVALPSFLFGNKEQDSQEVPAFSAGLLFAAVGISDAGCLSQRALGRASDWRRRLDLNDVVLDGIDDQIADGMQT